MSLRLQRGIASTAARVSIVYAALVVAWAASILVFQCLTWLQHQIWQPVPLTAALLSEVGRAFTLQRVDAQLTPLDLAPPLASYFNAGEIAYGVGGSSVRLRHLALFALDMPLVLWMLGIAIASGLVAARLRAICVELDREMAAKRAAE